MNAAETVFLSKEEEEFIVEAIKKAEKQTSGEIRIHVEGDCKYDVIDRAVNVFEKLGMASTELRNGVLIYVAVNDRKLAIIGDKGINEKVPDNFWDAIKQDMQEHFKKGQFTEGLIKAITKAGEQLKAHFPHGGAQDTDELSNQISY